MATPRRHPAVALVAAMMVVLTMPAVAHAGSAPVARMVDGRINDWRGATTQLGGTTQLSHGELIYQDHLFDDPGADTNQRAQQHGSVGNPKGDYRYPTDQARFANNVADLQELRVAADADNVWLLARMSALTQSDTTVVAIGFDLDAEHAAQRSWPRGAGFTAAGVDKVVTLWGSGGEINDLRSGTTMPLADVAVNTGNDNNAIEARVPRQLLKTSMTVFAATGLWDASGHQWMAVPNGSPTVTAPGGGSPLVTSRAWNIAFRPDETGSLYEEHQAAALAAGDISPFRSQKVRLDQLAAGISVPYRMRGGRFYALIIDTGFSIPPVDHPDQDNEGVSYDGIPGRFRGVGGAALAQKFEYLGRYQPYTLYVPTTYDGTTPMAAALVLHGIGGSHSTYNTQPGFIHDMGEGRDANGKRVARPMHSITPLARGGSFYADWGEADTLAVLGDALSRVPVDRSRLYITGYSMGGYGVYRLASLHPDLFAAAAVWAGYTGEFLGNSQSPQSSSSNGRANIGDPVDTLDNLRYLPFVHAAGTNDEIVPTAGQLAAPRKLAALGYRSRLDVYPGYEHFSFALVDDWKQGRAYLGDRVRETVPRDITYKFSDGWTAPGLAERLGLDHGNVWWLHDLTMRRSTTDGLELAGATVSSGAVPAPAVTPETTYASSPSPTPNVQQEVSWTATGRLPTANVLTMGLADVGTATVDLAGAKLRACGLSIDLTTDGPTSIRLPRGPQRTVLLTGLPGASLRQIAGSNDIVIDVSRAVTTPTRGTLFCPPRAG